MYFHFIASFIKYYYCYYYVLYQQRALNSSNTYELVSTSVESESEVFGSCVNPNKGIFMNNFRFIKAEDILFALGMDGECFQFVV